jgi:phosphoribosyl 1,2-cyclic phosphate phosphodiesterase
LLIERFDSGKRPTRVLVDTGPDMRSQLLAADVDHIDGVIYTHGHADHLHGIDDLRAFWLSTRRLVELYADDPTADRIEEGFAYCLKTAPGGSYPPIVRLNRMKPEGPFALGGSSGHIDILPYRQIHGDGSSTGFRFGGLAYSCDVSDLPDESAALLSGLEVWIIGALRHEPHPSHLTVAQALEWIDRLKPRRAILTHMHNDLDYATLRRTLPANVEPAYDGMQIAFSPP